MAWVVLIVSGVLEAVWATALGRAEGFTRLAPSIVFLVALALSMVGLSYAVKTLPTGTSYAVWVGIGASLTVGNRARIGGESAAHHRPHSLRHRSQARPRRLLMPLGIQRAET